GRWRTVAGALTALLLVGWTGLYQIGAPVWVPWAGDPPQADTTKAAVDAEGKRKAAQAEQQRLKEEEQRQAQAAADAQAKRKAAEAEQQRLAAIRAEEERKAKAEQAERERVAAAKAEEDRKAKVAALNRGIAYSETNDLDQAIAEYNQAIKFDPNYARAFN